MPLTASRVAARFLRASRGYRSFFAREERPDLYRDLQRQFLLFQKSLFDLADLAEGIADKGDQTRALDLIADLPELLDETIGLPHEEVLGSKYQPGLEKVERGLTDLAGLLGKTPLQRAQASVLKARMRVALTSLAAIAKQMERYAKVMGKQEALERQRAEKERIRAEKLEQKARENDKWCEKNCPACADMPDYSDAF